MTNSIALINKTGSLANSLDAYILQVKQIPILNPQTEQTLAEAFFFKKDLAAAKRLVLSNLRFVVYIAKSYMGYGLALADLIQEGNIGLMKAVKRFDPRMKVRLISFAVHWIKSEIQEFVLRNWRIVKVATTKAKRKVFFNLRKLKRLGWSTQKEVADIAQALDIKPETVRIMENHLNMQDIPLSLEEKKIEETSVNNHLPVAAFSDSRYDPAKLLEASDFTEQGSQALKQALVTLDGRSRDIIIQRWLNTPKATLDKLAKYYQVSIERIRQIEQHAMHLLKEQLIHYT
jgi:RNA polymerase sigma-32 factor